MPSRQRPCKTCLKPTMWETYQDTGGKWWAHTVNLDGTKHVCQPVGSIQPLPLLDEATS